MMLDARRPAADMQILFRANIRRPSAPQVLNMCAAIAGWRTCIHLEEKHSAPGAPLSAIKRGNCRTTGGAVESAAPTCQSSHHNGAATSLPEVGSNTAPRHFRRRGILWARRQVAAPRGQGRCASPARPPDHPAATAQGSCMRPSRPEVLLQHSAPPPPPLRRSQRAPAGCQRLPRISSAPILSSFSSGGWECQIQQRHHPRHPSRRCAGRQLMASCRRSFTP